MRRWFASTVVGALTAMVGAPDLPNAPTGGSLIGAAIAQAPDRPAIVTDAASLHSDPRRMLAGSAAGTVAGERIAHARLHGVNLAGRTEADAGWGLRVAYVVFTASMLVLFGKGLAGLLRRRRPRG